MLSYVVSGLAHHFGVDVENALVEAGIDSISVNPDNFVAVKRGVADAESAAERTDPGR